MSLQKHTVSWVFITFLIMTFIFIKFAILTSEETSNLSQINIAPTANCIIQNNVCTWTHNEQKFEFTFVSSPAVEEETLFRLVSDQPLSISRAWVEGINMYMGKTPVLANTVNENSFSGVFFLGSCNQAQMRWLLVIEVAGKLEPMKLQFSTQQ